MPPHPPHALPLPAARQFIYLLLLTFLALTALPARADYDPGVTWLERVHELHVRADATYVQTTQFLLRIDTEAAVEENAERRIRYSGSLELETS